MPNSLKSKLSSLRYKRLLTDEEYKELIKKLDGHDREIRAKAIDEFVDALLNYQSQDEKYKSFSDVCYEIAEQLKGVRND